MQLLVLKATAKSTDVKQVIIFLVTHAACVRALMMHKKLLRSSLLMASSANTSVFILVGSKTALLMASMGLFMIDPKIWYAYLKVMVGNLPITIAK